MKLVGVSSTLLATAFSASAPSGGPPVHNHENHDWNHKPAPHMEEFFHHSGAYGTGLGREESDVHYWASHSQVPSMPRIDGFMGTHGVYRHFTVMEQTAVMIGEPKHGVWRMQEAGVIREYLKGHATECWKEADGDANDVTGGSELALLTDNYSSFLANESYAGYKYPSQRLRADGCLNFVDLTIYHAKYNGTYENHVPMDLASYYCTMSQGNYVHVRQAWNFAKNQPLANKAGPLGKRAGLDIKENYINFVRFNMFPDANAFINIAGDAVRDTLEKLQAKPTQIDYEEIDLEREDMEVYIIERPFFNVPYLFIVCIHDNKASTGPSLTSYVRPHGRYYDELVKRGYSNSDFGTEIPWSPKVHAKNHVAPIQIEGMAVYGHHHPARKRLGLYGGACPTKGGDFGSYPWGTPGGAWPTQYEEIGPLCDGFALDVKIWTNLQIDTWLDPDFGAGNAGYDGTNVEYEIEPNQYGQFEDPYLTDVLNITNPKFIDMTGGVLITDAKDKLPLVKFTYNFTRPSYTLDYVTPTEDEMRDIFEDHYFQHDNSLRPTEDEELCASHDKTEHKSKMYWKPCNDAKFKIAYTHSVVKDKHYGPITTKGLVDAAGKPAELCWHVNYPYRAQKQTVWLKKCKEGEKRQMWEMADGQVWLHIAGESTPQFCVPFMGEDSKLRTKRCYGSVASFSINGRFEDDGHEFNHDHHDHDSDHMTDHESDKV